ncbi:ABC transporter ATP-binding protein [Rarobacter incanus]|uniref:ABC-2 type transport system ATP-binding protein n=1 Tax=Rarobacter incanus TaxID=153494 RepID=A0A542SPS3_9MICO|nr:ABC transporter ATP-binding protein [Rarobacter incanus]TQK76619.1 ABC-2 type transport system ATP-binding protein [Rarobacter incanus]
MTKNAVAIRAERLTVTRGSHRVLHDIDLTVTRGAITGLLGPSGSGKTTLMRSLLGVQIIESGTVTVLGKPAGDPALRRRVGYVTQAPSIYPDLTVRENIAYFARILLGRGARGAIDEAIATVGLEAQAGQLAATLSGGQASRVSLATALLGAPDVLVLDEPTVGLDPVLRASLWDLFTQIAARGCTLIVSSHVMDEAAHCDDLVLLRQGKIVFRDNPSALLAATGLTSYDDAFLALVTREPGSGTRPTSSHDKDTDR